jgi:hypothetical protein
VTAPLVLIEHVQRQIKHCNENWGYWHVVYNSFYLEMWQPEGIFAIMLNKSFGQKNVVMTC